MKVSERKCGQIIDAKTGTVVTTPKVSDRKIDLKTLVDIRREMRRVYLMVDAGTLPEESGTKRIYMLKSIGEVVAAADFEQRVQQLEESQQKRLEVAQRDEHQIIQR